MYDEDERMIDGGQILPKYKVGEVVAIAQSYKDLGYDPDSLDRDPKDLGIRGFMKHSAGWNNKMFVSQETYQNHRSQVRTPTGHIGSGLFERRDYKIY